MASPDERMATWFHSATRAGCRLRLCTSEVAICCRPAAVVGRGCSAFRRVDLPREPRRNHGACLGVGVPLAVLHVMLGRSTLSVILSPADCGCPI